jgi:hypothetical protein
LPRRLRHLAGMVARQLVAVPFSRARHGPGRGT